eukprot:s1791_g12.t2
MPSLRKCHIAADALKNVLKECGGMSWNVWTVVPSPKPRIATWRSNIWSLGLIVVDPKAIMPPCPSPAGSVSPGMRKGEASADDCEGCEGLTSMPSGAYADKLQALEEEFLMARRDRGDFDVRINRTSEQMDRLWQDFANERRERQVEVNEERMLRVAEMAELRERIDKLSKVAHFEPEGNCLNDPPVLETYIEEPQEDQNGAPELTADGQGSKLVFDAKHAEAQLRRLVADAKRAEAMVRREVGRAIADARTYLEDTGHQQQEFWAARQRMAAFCRNGNGDTTTNPTMSEALSLHLDSEMKMRTRLEAIERGFNSVQKCVENLQSLPQQMEAYVNEEIEQVRTELKESLEERQKKRRLSEVEHSAVKQAIGEVRFDVVSHFQKEVKTLREEFGRSRSDEAYRQSLRIHEIEDRISAVEKYHVSTSSGDEAKSASAGLKEGTGECGSALRTLRTENMQVKVEVRAEMQKMKQELDAVARRVADTSVANLADLDQRFSHVEEKLRLLDPQARSGARDAEANLHRLDDVLQEVEIMKKCLEELAQRFGQESQDGKGSMSPRSFRLQVQGSGQAPNSITTTPQNSYVPVATNSWVAPRVVVSPIASPAPPSREVLTAQVQRQASAVATVAFDGFDIVFAMKCLEMEKIHEGAKSRCTYSVSKQIGKIRAHYHFCAADNGAYSPDIASNGQSHREIKVCPDGSPY